MNKQQEQKTSQPDSEKKSGGIGKLFFWFMLFTFLLTGFGLYLAKESVMEVFRSFKPKRVIQSFTDYRDLKVKGNEGNILEVATGEETIILTQEDSVQIYGKIVPGVKTVSQINLPVTFRYHIDLNDEWKLVDEGHRLHVRAPSLRATLPVAFDSTKMEKFNPGWSKYITGDNMPALEKSITPKLEDKAKAPERIVKFHDEARKSIASFVQTWLVEKGQWGDDKFAEIVVTFDGEIFEPEEKVKIPDLRVEPPTQ